MQTTTKQTYRIFWKHARRYPGTGIVMVVSIIAATLFSIAPPLYYKDFFDLIATASPTTPNIVKALINLLLAVLALGSAQWVCSRIATFLNMRFELRVMTDIANSSFRYLEAHSHSFLVNRFVGSLVRRFNRLVDAFETITDRFCWDILPLVVRLTAIIAILAFRNTLIAWVLFGWAVLYMIVNYYITLFKLEYDKASAAADSIVTGRLSDTLASNTTVKLFTALDYEHAQFQKLTEDQRRARQKAWNVSIVTDGVQAGFMIALEFTVFYVAVMYWKDGRLTVGDFALIQVYVIQVFSRLWDFGRIFRNIYKSLADSAEMVEILNQPHDIQDKPTAGKLAVPRGEIDFRDVTFNYHETRVVIRNLSLTVAPGEKVGLVGPSGAGKSTIVGLVLRLFDATSGGVFIDGQNIADVTQDSLRENIALVPQDPILFHRTLMENIRYGRRGATDEEVIEAARLAHCDEFIEQIPERYDAYVGEKGVKLSGGERQRVAIARAILKNAPILVLDEATSSLDSRSEAAIKDALETLMRGKTVIVIAHRLSTVMKMDRIVVIQNGKIYEMGTHAKLLEKENGLYRGLWNLQAGGFIA